MYCLRRKAGGGARAALWGALHVQEKCCLDKGRGWRRHTYTNLVPDCWAGQDPAILRPLCLSSLLGITSHSVTSRAVLAATVGLRIGKTTRYGHWGGFRARRSRLRSRRVPHCNESRRRRCARFQSRRTSGVNCQRPEVHCVASARGAEPNLRHRDSAGQQRGDSCSDCSWTTGGLGEKAPEMLWFPCSVGVGVNAALHSKLAWWRD